MSLIDEEIDSNCNHDWDYDLIKQQGIVFCVWKCNKCYGEHTQTIGEAWKPEKGVDY